MQTQNIPTKLSIKNLRQSGWKVRVLHERNYFLRNRFDGNSTEVCARGGRTEIQLTSPDKKITRNWNGYIIGADSTESDTFEHEICHGLYATNKEYKVLVDEITETIEWQDYLKFEKNLLDMGYTAAVIPDEIQA